MPFNGAGQFTPSAADNPVVASTLIQSTKFNNTINDVATGLSTCLTKDGQQIATANQPMGGFRHTNVANASNRNEYAAVGQVQDQGFSWCGNVGGTADALTLTPTPAVTAYAAGQSFVGKATATNTLTIPTVAISSLAVKTIQKDGGALVAGDITTGKWYRFTYDGTNFQLERLQLPLLLLGAANIWTGTNSFLDGVNFSLKNTADPTKILQVDATGIPTATTVTAKVSGAGVVEGIQGASVASAGTINLDTATGDYVHLTGVTTCTAITLAQGRQRTTVTDGVMQFTNGASLVLPTGANITSAAGDTQIWRGEAAGVVRCIGYFPASAIPLGTPTAAQGSSLVLLSSQSASASATIDFTSGLTATYDEYEFHVNGLTIVTDNQDLWIRISEDGGSTFKAGATDYSWNVFRTTDAATNTSVGSTGDTKIISQASITNTSGRQNLVIKFTRPSSAAANKAFSWLGTHQASAGGSITSMGSGYYKTDNTAINAVRFLMSSGNITSGSFLLYGVKKT